MTSQTSSAAGRKANVLSLTVEREQGFTVGGGVPHSPKADVPHQRGDK